AQSPLRLGKARVYLAGHQLIKHFVPARAHLRGKLSQIHSFVVRAKTKSGDQVCCNCCDLIPARIEERQSHREALELPTTMPDRISSRRAVAQTNKGARVESSASSAGTGPSSAKSWRRTDEPRAVGGAGAGRIARSGSQAESRLRAACPQRDVMAMRINAEALRYDSADASAAV